MKLTIILIWEYWKTEIGYILVQIEEKLWFLEEEQEEVVNLLIKQIRLV